jgi:hypothetical protein
MTWLSLLCPSCRPHDLKNWLDSLHKNCVNPKGIELSLTLEHQLDPNEFERWGGVKVTYVTHGQYNINQLTEICYKQSTSPYIFLSGDDTICHFFNWDGIFHTHLIKYKDKVVLVYPNDLIFGENLACYPVTSRVVMDSVAWPVPFERYAIDDTIFDIVPRERRIYLRHVVMEHLHLVENPPGMPVEKNGKTFYYPHEPEAMGRDRTLFRKLQGQRDEIRRKLALIAGLNMSNRVMLCVPTGEFARRADFYDYFNALEKPEGTMMTFSHGQSPARNRNIMIQMALDNNATHCLFLDDDMAFKPDLLIKLLAHDKDIVSGLYLMRNYPHMPVMFDAAYDNGSCRFRFVRPEDSGLIEVVNIGLGACLIKTDVFKQMPKPWITLGECEPDHWSDDISFFNRCRKMGFKMYVDLDIPCGHMLSAIIWPDRDEKGNWYTMYNTGAPEAFRVPQRIPTDEEMERSLKLAGVSKQLELVKE